MVVAVVVCRNLRADSHTKSCFERAWLGCTIGRDRDGSCLCCNCDAVAEDGNPCLASLLYASHVAVGIAESIHTRSMVMSISQTTDRCTRCLGFVRQNASLIAHDPILRFIPNRLLDHLIHVA